MEYTFKALNGEEIMKLTPQQLEVQIEELRNAYNTLNSLSYEIVSKKLAEIVCDYDIEHIDIDSNYSYNDNGFDGRYMVTIDDDDVSDNSEQVPSYSKNAPKISYSDLQVKIDTEMEKLQFIIKEDMGFDVKELRNRYRYAEMEKAITAKPEGKSSSRYKL